MRTQTVVAEPEMRNIQTVIVGSRLSTLKSSVRLGRTLRWYLNPESHKFETDRQRLIYMSEIMIVKKKHQLQETLHSTVLLGCFYLLYMWYCNLSRVVCC